MNRTPPGERSLWPTGRWRKAALREGCPPEAFTIFTHLTERERLLLFDLAGSLAANATVVEIGSYLGASTSFLAAGVRLRSGRVFAVDTWENQGMTEGPRDTFREFLDNTSALSEAIVPSRGTSLEWANRFESPIDLLFVDGDHEYTAVRVDLEAWLPKVRHGGIVAMHDYAWAEGVRRAVREVLAPVQIEGGHHLDNLYWSRIGTYDPTPPQVAMSVVVPTCRNDEALAELLASLAAEASSTGCIEVVIVDNTPAGTQRDAVAAWQDRFPSPLRYVHEPRPGLHNARHGGALASRASVIAFLDDDVVVRGGWGAALLAAFDDPAVAIAGGRALPRWESPPPPWIREFPDSYLSLLDRGEKPVDFMYPDGAYGCNMAIRRAVLFEAGGFNPDAYADPRYRWLRGDGETGLHLKVEGLGLRARYMPHAVVEHRVPAARTRYGALARRACLVGLSQSYTALRALRGGRLWWARLLAGIARATLRAARALARVVAGRVTWRRGIADLCLWSAYAAQHLQVLLRPALRRHVWQDTYLGTESGGSG